MRPDATPAQVRAAYLARARRLHPDHQAATGDDNPRAVRRMQRVNEAWSVLGEPQRRAAYDASLRPHRPPAAEPPRVRTPPAGAPRREAPVPAAAPDSWFLWAVRVAPLLLVMAVLVVVFVVTAFARSDPPRPPGSGVFAPGDCVRINGGDLVPSPCDGSQDAVIVTVGAESCSGGALARALPSGTRACLRPSGG